MTHDTPRALAARMALPLARIMDTRHAAERAAHVAQILTLGEIDATPLEVATAVCVHARRPNGGGARYIDERATVGEIEAALAEVVRCWRQYCGEVSLYWAEVIPGMVVDGVAVEAIERAGNGWMGVTFADGVCVERRCDQPVARPSHPSQHGHPMHDDWARRGGVRAECCEGRDEWSGLMDGDAMLSGGRSHQGVSR